MIPYIIKSSLSLLILFGLYWFLLRKEKLFIFNRFFLVLSVVFSMVVPFISIPVNFQVTPQLEHIIPTYYNVIPEISSSAIILPHDVNINQPYVGKQTSPIDISEILLAIYISVVLLFFIRFLRNIYIIIHKVKCSEKKNFEGYRIVLTNDKTGPYCFFTNIFLNREDFINGRIDKELFNHELGHVRQSHSLDIILIELVKIFYWFNPIHLLYDRAIRLNHEYLADNGIICDNSNIKSYSEKLLNFITSKRNMSLTSGSYHSFTKMRLMMILKPGSRRFIYGARIALTICIGTVFFLLLSFKESDKQSLAINLTGDGTEITNDLIRKTDYLGNQTNILNVQEVNFRNSYFSPMKALAVIDGKVLNYNGDLKVNPVDIKTIKVLKEKEATDKYGEKGKDGVIEIILFKNDQDVSKNDVSDSSLYITRLSVNHVSNKGELIDIPVSNLKSISVWTSSMTPKNSQKDLRTIVIMTRDYFKVEGMVVQEEDKPLSGVAISIAEEQARAFSDKEGRFVIEDVGEDALLVFSYPGYKPYHLATKFEVPFNMEMTIELEKDIDMIERVAIRDSKALPYDVKPLAIVDGVESKFGMDMINPNEINSIAVLKDAKATDLYRTKGANGVILVTAKKKTLEYGDNKLIETIIFTQQDTANNNKSVKQDEREDAVVAPVNMNVLYLGISNPVEIAVPGVTSDKVTATITNGRIYKTASGWEAIPQTMGESVINVLVDNKKVTEKRFRVKSIPLPVAVFAGKSNGTISKDDVLNSTELEAILPDFGRDLKFEIKSFTLLYSKDGDDYQLIGKGNTLTDEMMTHLSDLKPGQNIIFKDIRATGPDRRTRDLPPIIIKIN